MRAQPMVNLMSEVEIWLVVAATVVAVVACVALHYEGLRLLGKVKITRVSHRHRIIFMILCILLLHTIEIWIFGVTYYLLLLEGSAGTLVGIPDAKIFDIVYFSATVFSTLGFGDIIPTGAIRFVTGTESLAGLTLITWSASFTFIEMTKIYDSNNESQND